MNSSDYDDFITMFSVPTPISPLPPIPVASPTHEPSQDVIYDSLPPMEKSTGPEERRNEERRMRKDGMRNEGYEMSGYCRPNFRPPYRRPDYKPRVFRRPPYEQQLMPTSQENAQVFFRSQSLAVLCIRNNGFTRSNGVVS
ncbi:hypothetical protein TNCV_1306771 [Trichonephila clavipes]|nr:hypothetical protein TNCV_1306771 [Trichonephila clavipes]